MPYDDDSFFGNASRAPFTAPARRPLCWRIGAVVAVLGLLTILYGSFRCLQLIRHLFSPDESTPPPSHENVPPPD